MDLKKTATEYSLKNTVCLSRERLVLLSENSVLGLRGLSRNAPILGIHSSWVGADVRA